MGLMPLTLEWRDVGIRILLAAIAGILIGFDRGESGKVAGLRTTLLVCLAACLSMLEVNALLAQSGKTPESFVQLDVMRLPLGILSGVGFIGAGAILRKDGLVKGVTTAATLWFVTVVGLCFGGGQLGLGVAGVVLGIIVLWFMKAIEVRIPRENQAELKITYEPGRFSKESLMESMRARGCRLSAIAGTSGQPGDRVQERYEVRWYGVPKSRDVPPFVECATKAGAEHTEWSITR
ncbi:MgtC/SapB transporter [Burkholderia sp. 8Y]|uniref:MgtC/SapB family protein n=1 Tax=Burkholderia sp. 8Y TaxID=2653133 RepID=UPI0012F18184|nr:MgtC/SapB family protein [Burkholderia sp. 8Y]VXB41072.1 MgtC/SapB transporter [Burkholderia sp. 8Y]